MTEKYMYSTCKSTFGDLGLNISPEVFLNSCEAANYNPNTGLEAIKEFSTRLDLPREKIPEAWNEFMSDTERMVDTLSRWNVLDENTILDFLEKDLIWLVSLNVTQKENPLNLIKVRL
jgi:hypothetical protein